MNRKTKSIPITIEDVAFIFTDNMDQFDFSVQNCYCSQCQKDYQSTISNYSIELNDLFDIVLKGSCLECGQPMARYIETGDNPTTAPNAESIWRTHHALKELKIKKNKH